MPITPETRDRLTASVAQLVRTGPARQRPRRRPALRRAALLRLGAAGPAGARRRPAVQRPRRRRRASTSRSPAGSSPSWSARVRRAPSRSPGRARQPAAAHRRRGRRARRRPRLRSDWALTALCRLGRGRGPPSHRPAGPPRRRPRGRRRRRRRGPRRPSPPPLNRTTRPHAHRLRSTIERPATLGTVAPAPTGRHVAPPDVAPVEQQGQMTHRRDPRGAVRDVAGDVRGVPVLDRRLQRAADDHHRPARHPEPVHLGGHRDPARLDGLHADLGQARRPVQQEAADPARDRHLHRRLDAGRALPVGGDPHRLAGAAGPGPRWPAGAGADRDGGDDQPPGAGPVLRLPRRRDGGGDRGGPLLGGLLVDTSWLGWRWCFYVGVPFAAVALVLLQRRCTCR